MRVLVTGANGQVGWELQRTAPDCHEVLAVDRLQLDIVDFDAVEECFRRFKPDVIVNAAAYTAVDKAEAERGFAFAINGDAPGYIAKLANEMGIRLIHISTDFVFDGKKSTPYTPEDKPRPINVYGASKLEGEKRVLQSNPNAVIIRTAWIYSAHGNNFVKTMLRLMKERDQLGVVTDQIGTPTWASSLATAIWRITELPDISGVYHYTDAGVASWYDFAVAIQEEAMRLGILEKEISITPISTQDYPTPADRPSYSLLEKQLPDWDVDFIHWRCALRKMLGRFED